MKTCLFLMFTNLLVVCSVLSQSTFNKHYYFNGIAAIGNGVYVTDSCYYVSGLVVDTINGNPQEGFFVSKLNLLGEIESTYRHVDTLNSYENWRTPLLFHDDAFTSVGFGRDSLMYMYLLRLDYKNDTMISLNKYRSYYYPQDSFIQPIDVVYDEIKEQYYITTLIGRYENNGVLNENYSILCLDKDGSKLWENDYGGIWEDLSRTIIKDDNSIIIGSLRANFNLTSSNLKYYSKILAVDTLGNNLWSWQSSHSVQQGTNDMLVSEDGGLVVASGRGYLHPINSEENAAYWDRGLVFKLNQEHEIEWECELRVPYPGVNELNNLIKAVDGSGYVVAGKQTDLYGEDPGGTVMGWLAKVSETGDSLWSRKLFYYELPDSLEYWHQIHDLQSTPDGGYIMSGQTLDRNQLSFPIQQAWYIKVDAEGCLIPNCGLVDSKEVSEIEGAPLLLYPNPAKDYLNVYMGDNGGEDWYFHIVNAQGLEVGQYIAPTAHTTYMIAIEHLPAVAYYLQLKDKDGRLMKTYPWVKGE